MDSKGNDALLTKTKVTEYNFNHGGYIPVTFGLLLLLGCIAAYVIAVTRGNVDPILPLISDAAGSPPQNGVFGTIICVGGMFGVTFMIQRYMIVLDQNGDKNNMITSINKLALVVGVGSMLGITLITGYPVNFYRNRKEWHSDVGLPHMIGGVMLFALGLLYIALQCALTLFLKRKNGWILPLRILLLFICTAAFAYHFITIPDNFKGLSHLYYENSTDLGLNNTDLVPYPSTLGTDLKLMVETGGTYFKSAVTQWAFVFFFCCFFFTFFGELQEYSLLFTIETHTPKENIMTEEQREQYRKASLIQRSISQESAKPPPELRKVLRRDSVCQTIDEVPSLSKTNTNGTANKDASKKVMVDKKKILLDAEVDAKLNRLLNQVEKKDGKTGENGVQCNTTNGTHKSADKKGDTDSEAERIAIKKIDDVVKNAEKEEDRKNSKITDSVKKADEDEERPSSCPLAVQ